MIDPLFWKNRRVFLTGHTGFKGSWLLLWLLKLGANVSAASIDTHQPNDLFSYVIDSFPPGIKWQHNVIDITNPLPLKECIIRFNPEVVIHLAAQPLVRLSYSDPIGTWSTNVMGSLHVLDSLRDIDHTCAVVMVTTDKVYENKEWEFGYREVDPLGGVDPYSSSKAAAEIAINSWRSSFCGSKKHQNPHLRISSARAGNVIGGGDWALDRIVPDSIRSLQINQPIAVRNPMSTRPWQHVLEPLSGYLLLAQSLFLDKNISCGAFNFGPTLDSNRSVKSLVEAILISWPGLWIDNSSPEEVHEASLLHLQIDKAYHQLRWKPLWDFDLTVERTVNWYKNVFEGHCPVKCTLNDIVDYSGELAHQAP